MRWRGRGTGQDVVKTTPPGASLASRQAALDRI